MRIARVKVPDVRTALKLYYEKPELNNDDIMQLFGVSRGRATQMKKNVQQKMREEDVKTYMIPYSVNTEVAFRCWGIDIADYEKRLKKLQSLKLEEDQKGA